MLLTVLNISVFPLNLHFPSTGISPTLKGRVSRNHNYVLRRLKLFHLQPRLHLNLYRIIIEPILIYCSMIFLPLVSVSQNSKLFKLANTASNIIGLPALSLSEITDGVVFCKARSISADSSHPLYNEFKLLPSARRLKHCVKNMFKYSFIPKCNLRAQANLFWL